MTFPVSLRFHGNPSVLGPISPGPVGWPRSHAATVRAYSILYGLYSVSAQIAILPR